MTQNPAAIYQFLLNLVKTEATQDVLAEFYTLFFKYAASSRNAEARKELTSLLAANDFSAFVSTLKRCCYILINNWDSKRNYESINDLVTAFVDRDRFHLPMSGKNARLKSWLETFCESQDYQDLKLYTRKHLKSDKKADRKTDSEPWSNRYTSYLLVAQYSDDNNSQEQREVALKLSQELRNKFKFDLAMYAARSQSSVSQKNRLENPTNLGEDALHLIKKIILRKGNFNYKNLAHIFIEQTRDCQFKIFKDALQNYLFFTIENTPDIQEIKRKFAGKMQRLYQKHNFENLDRSLFLRTCKQAINFLTTETGEKPSEVFNIFWLSGSPLTLAILLLKIVLICPNSQTHLDSQIAKLIKIYQVLPKEDCDWALKFFEILNIVLAIYADNKVFYSLIPIEQENKLERNSSEDIALDSYRIYSQCLEYFNRSPSWQNSDRYYPQNYHV